METNRNGTMNRGAIVKKLARHGMEFASKRGYGLGEIAFNVNHWALDEIEECDAYVSPDDRIDDPIEAEDDKCSMGDEAHAVHIKEAKSLAREAIDLAMRLEDVGISTFN